MLFGTKPYTLLAQQVSATERRLAELVEQHHHLYEALAHQQIQAEEERAALRETLSSLLAEVRELAPAHRRQQEALATLDQEMHAHLDHFRADLAACTQRLQHLEASVAQVVTRLQALEAVALAGQPRDETTEPQLAPAHTSLQEEAHAREAPTQQGAGSSTHKAPQRPGKSGKRNGATLHTQL